MPNEDLLQSILRGPSRTSLDGRDYPVPYASAAEWLGVLGHNPRLLVVQLAPGAADAAAERVLDGSLTEKDLENASFALLSEHTGLDWWVALKLVYISLHVSTLGELTLRGVDPHRVSIGQWCAAVRSLMFRNLDQKERLKLEFDLSLPPPGYEDAWDHEDAGFAAMAALERKMMAERRNGGQ